MLFVIDIGHLNLYHILYTVLKVIILMLVLNSYHTSQKINEKVLNGI